MTYEQRGVWVYLVSGIISYGAYLVIVLGQAATAPLAETHYVVPLLSAIGVSIALAVVGRIALEIAKPSDSHRKDDRDRAIDRIGDYRAQWFIIAGALAALVLALLDADTFWIANAVYLSFVLWAVVGSVIKLLAYGRGF
ncbi:MAG: hypothetical protein ACOH1T_01275 [Microbacteriaceae bacterium]